MKIRLIFGPLLFGVVLGILWLDAVRDSDVGFACLVGVFAIGGLLEVCSLFEAKGWKPVRMIGAAVSVLYLALVWMEPRADWLEGAGFLPRVLGVLVGLLSPEAIALALLVGLLFLHQLRSKGQFDFGAFSGTLFAWVYPAFLMGFLIRLRTMSPGEYWILYLFLTNKVNDSVAFGVGKSVGGPKFAPTVSPNKTWSGSIGGIVAGTAAGLALFWFEGSAREWAAGTWILFTVMTICVVVAAQLSDLAESALKRWAGRKDSGRIPAFGGILDMLDSFLLSAPVALLVAIAATRKGWIG